MLDVKLMTAVFTVGNVEIIAACASIYPTVLCVLCEFAVFVSFAYIYDAFSTSLPFHYDW